MPDQATTTYGEKVQELADLKLKAAQAERDVKAELKRRKGEAQDPTSARIINTYTAWAAGAGLFMGAPVISGAALTAIQLRMLDKLAEAYGQNFTENEARNTLLAITGGLVTPLVAGMPITAIAFMLPVVGPLAGLAAGPALAGISTRLVGRLFVEHFEAGGKIADLNVSKARQDLSNGLKEEAKKESTPSAL
jgi:uncharacterized protein (DUF697 family)